MQYSICYKTGRRINMDLEWHEFTHFDINLHPADQWIEWERREVEYFNKQKELRKTKDDDETKRGEVYLFQKLLNKLKEKENDTNK